MKSSIAVLLSRFDGTEIRLGNFITASFCRIATYELHLGSMNYSNSFGTSGVVASKQQDLNFVNSCNE